VAQAARPLAERVREIKWFHSIDLGGGLVTPGQSGAGWGRRAGVADRLAVHAYRR
jgi:hypothetical protein